MRKDLASPEAKSERKVKAHDRCSTDLWRKLRPGRALGLLAERFDLPIHDAFEVLRAAARDSGREARAIAEEITTAREKTPAEIFSALERRPES